MNNFLVITNTYKDADNSTTNLIMKHLTDNSCKCTIYDGLNVSDNGENSFLHTNPEKIPKDIECVIVLGGDGTLIQASRDLVGKDVPFIGVNFGKLGFLAEVERTDVVAMLDKLIAGEYDIEERMMLEGTIFRNGAKVGSNIALNDIVINRYGMLRVIEFKVYVNGKLLNTYIADGIIVSTPTGSTAYNLSAGGPIARPDANLIIVTPLCPHTLNTRSIVLSDTDEIAIEICEDRNVEGEKRAIAFDGCETEMLNAGDLIIISKSDMTTKIVKLSDMSFLEILQHKMSDTGR